MKLAETAKTDLNVVINVLKATESMVHDLLNGDEYLKEQVLSVYAGLATAMDAFIQAAYVAKTDEHRQIILNKLNEQLIETYELINQSAEGKVIKFPGGRGTPQA